MYVIGTSAVGFASFDVMLPSKPKGEEINLLEFIPNSWAWVMQQEKENNADKTMLICFIVSLGFGSL